MQINAVSVPESTKCSTLLQNKKNDPNKVDKKFVYKHGLCPPLKNCRRRRFRKTLKKKFVEAPEIEKEVKRLLRNDNDAIDVKYSLVTEEELNAARTGDTNENTREATSVSGDPASGEAAMGAPTAGPSAGPSGAATSAAIDEQDLFGALSDDSDEEQASSSRQNTSNIEMEEDSMDVADPNSKVVVDDDSRSMSSSQPGPSTSSGLVTQFNKGMFSGASSSTTASKQDALLQEISDLKVKKEELEKNIENCDNFALQQRFKDSLADVVIMLQQKTAELESI